MSILSIQCPPSQKRERLVRAFPMTSPEVLCGRGNPETGEERRNQALALLAERDVHVRSSTFVRRILPIGVEVEVRHNR